MDLTILIADDETNQIELIDYNLKKSGFAVIKAQNGIEAFEKTLEYKPDLLILDWMMPKLTGIEVCRKLRGKKETESIPIIILSARSEDTDKSYGLDTGADDYISKPFSPKELISRVKSLLRRTNPSKITDILEFKDIKVFLKEMKVMRKGKLIKLGPKEFKILTLFLERPGQIFSRSKILDFAWGNNVYVEERTVDVHMSRLRKALNYECNNDSDNEIIRTVRDGGYGLDIN